MNVIIENQELIISSSGLEYVRLKTEIARRLGNLSKSVRGTIRIPIATLPIISDLLSSDVLDLDIIQKNLNAFTRHSIARVEAKEILEKDLSKNINGYWLEILDAAQAVAVSAMILPNLLGICLFDEQGSGKTVMSIASFDLLKESNLIDKAIIACPKSVISEWSKDFQKFAPEKYKVLEAEGDRKQKYELALTDFDVLVTNYEGIDVMLTSLIATSNNNRYLLVIDESYYLKNGASVRSGNISKLRSFCQRCYMLCGTPAPNSSHDLINQFNLADLGFTFGGFRKSNDATYDWPFISDLIEGRGLFIRRLKEQILANVPEKNFHVISAPLTGRQLIMYERAKTDLALELRTFDNSTFKKNLARYFQRRSVLLQICCCPFAIDPTLTELPVKYVILDNLLADLTNQKRKVIIWSFYTKSIEDLMERYSKYNPVKVDGSVSTQARKAAVKLFQEDPSTYLFIGNPAAAGAGITLHASYDAVYISYSNQAAHYLQSLDRIHRRGQVSDHVNYYLIACKDTIEETEIIRLRGKELSQHSLLGDIVTWPNSLDDALNELTKND